MNLDVIRLNNLNRLIRELGTVAAVAKAGNTGEKYLSQILNGHKTQSGKPRTLGDRVARRLEDGCFKPRGWMDTPEESPLGPTLTADEAELLRRYRQACPGHKKAIQAVARLKVTP